MNHKEHRQNWRSNPLSQMFYRVNIFVEFQLLLQVKQGKLLIQ